MCSRVVLLPIDFSALSEKGPQSFSVAESGGGEESPRVIIPAQQTSRFVRQFAQMGHFSEFGAFSLEKQRAFKNR